jgi:hypothetical protein
MILNLQTIPKLLLVSLIPSEDPNKIALPNRRRHLDWCPLNQRRHVHQHYRIGGADTPSSVWGTGSHTGVSNTAAPIEFFLAKIKMSILVIYYKFATLVAYWALGGALDGPAPPNPSFSYAARRLSRSCVAIPYARRRGGRRNATSPRYHPRKHGHHPPPS